MADIYIYPPIQVTIETGALATSAKQDEQTALLTTIESNIDSVEASLSSIDGKVLTDTQLRATPVPVSGPLTDTELRATPVDVNVPGTISVTGPLTDAELRATPVPVSGPLTDTELRATAVPVSGPLTDAELRATAVPVDGSGVTQPISAASLPLPTGAATETTLASIDSKITAVDTDSVTVTSSALPTGAATEATLSSIDGKVPANLTVTATRLLVDGSGVTQPVSASDLDIRDLSSAQDSVAAVQSGTWNITDVSGTVSLPTGASTAANQSTIIGHLSDIENELTSKLSGSLVPEVFDYIALTYVTVGNGIGEIETVVYKTGGSGGTTVATLTLAYDANDKLSSVTRS